jgi:tetratricopeptide (TPR) repeat protein
MGRITSFGRYWRMCWYALLSGVVLGGVGGSSALAASIAWEHVANPYIRAAQFDLYGGDSFAALTQLLVDQRQGRVNPRSGQAQLVLGGMYLAYGSHRKAAQTFQILGESNQSREVRDLAWYHLARTQYQHGLRDETLAALNRIESKLPAEQQQERLLLYAMLLMQRKRYDEAEESLRQLGKRSLRRQLGEKSVWTTYGRFNLGVALFRRGEEEEGRELLEELGEMSVEESASKALRDKANLTLAYYYLDKNDSDRARRYFVKSHLDGPLSGKALLGLGRVYSAKGLHKKSLAPWLKLIKRDPSDPAVQDGLLAVPFAFGKLDAYKQALEYYQQALAVYQREIEQVDEMKASVNSGVLVDNLTDVVGEQQADEQGFLSALPDIPGARYLWPLFSTDEFRQTLKRYAQLRLSLGRLQQWSSQVESNQTLSTAKRTELARQIDDLRDRLNGMTDRLRGYLQGLALDELARHKQRLSGYAGEARFSLAQVYDYAAKRWGGGQ